MSLSFPNPHVFYENMCKTPTLSTSVVGTSSRGKEKPVLPTYRIFSAEFTASSKSHNLQAELCDENLDLFQHLLLPAVNKILDLGLI